MCRQRLAPKPRLLSVAVHQGGVGDASQFQKQQPLRPRIHSAAHRTRVPRRTQSMTGGFREAVAMEAVARRSAMRQEQLVQALGRLDDGTYGQCSGCADLIEEARLDGDPCNALCSRWSRLRG